MRIYISGAITGNENYQKDFERGEKIAALLNCIPVNPAKLSGQKFRNASPAPAWEDYMKFDIPLLCGCQAVLMLKGWVCSKGANLEHDIASRLGMQIFYEERMEKEARDAGKTA